MREQLESMIKDFLSMQDDETIEDSSCTERQEASYVLEKFMNYFYLKEIERLERKTLYFELKKEFENDETSL